MIESRDEMLARHARELATLDAPKLARCGCGGCAKYARENTAYPDIVNHHIKCDCGIGLTSINRDIAVRMWNRAMSRPKLGLWVAVDIHGHKGIWGVKPVREQTYWMDECESCGVDIVKGHPIDLLTADMTWDSEAREI